MSRIGLPNSTSAGDDLVIRVDRVPVRQDGLLEPVNVKGTGRAAVVSDDTFDLFHSKLRSAVGVRVSDGREAMLDSPIF